MHWLLGLGLLRPLLKIMSLSRNGDHVGRFLAEAAFYAQPLRINQFEILFFGDTAYRHRGTAFGANK